MHLNFIANNVQLLAYPPWCPHNIFLRILVQLSSVETHFVFFSPLAIILYGAEMGAA